MTQQFAFCVYTVYTVYTVCVYNAWALPRRCSVEGPHSQSNVVATLHSVGKINKDQQVLGNTKIPPPLNSTFSWEDQQRYWGILKSHHR